jgi:hypothetical protein
MYPLAQHRHAIGPSDRLRLPRLPPDSVGEMAQRSGAYLPDGLAPTTGDILDFFAAQRRLPLRAATVTNLSNDLTNRTP